MSTRSDRGNRPLRRELGLSLPDYDYGNSLRLAQWDYYWPKRTITDFKNAYGVENVTVETFTANEQLKTRLQDWGLDAYDLVFPSDWMISRLIDADMLAPVDRSKLSNWSNLSDRWVERAPYDTGSARYSVPYHWGTTGIGWNETLIQPSEGISSWDAMWNDAWAGQMTMLDNPREAIGAALSRLGHSLNTRDPDEIAEAKAILLQQKDLLMEYDSRNMIGNLVDARASPVHTWNGEAFIANDQLSEGGSNGPVNYAIPEEGSIIWIDAATIPRKAPNANTAHLFVDYILNPRVSAAITNYVNYPSANEAARQHIEDSILNNDLVYPPESVLENLTFVQTLGDARDLYNQAWQEIKQA